jgi:hypothetical protein
MDNEKRKQLLEYTRTCNAVGALEGVQFYFDKGSEERKAVELLIEKMKERQTAILDEWGI